MQKSDCSQILITGWANLSNNNQNHVFSMIANESLTSAWRYFGTLFLQDFFKLINTAGFSQPCPQAEFLRYLWLHNKPSWTKPADLLWATPPIKMQQCVWGRHIQLWQKPFLTDKQSRVKTPFIRIFANNKITTFYIFFSSAKGSLVPKNSLKDGTILLNSKPTHFITIFSIRLPHIVI